MIASPLEKEAHHQVTVRAANESATAAWRRGGGDRVGAAPFAVGCECGDVACVATLEVSRPEYEDVRALGSRFLIRDTHENPEISLVVSTNARFAVVETVGREARRIVLRGNPRSGWATR